MKHRYAMLVLLALLITSLFTSYHSYRATANWVNKSMDRALALTMAEQQTAAINQDTIRVFNSHLQVEKLRGKATLAVDTRQKKFVCYAKCSVGTIFSLSDQRPAVALWTLSFCWVAFCIFLRRRNRLLGEPLLKEGFHTYGGITYSDVDRQFLASSGEIIQLTPMQQQVMEMFFHAPSHRVSKAEICEALWPKKPDAYDTLYTLIRRLRLIVEEHSNLKIESDRSRSYCLKDKGLG